MLEVPEGSIYFWCYVQGLKHVLLDELTRCVIASGKELRDKDIQNYWNGWYNSDMYKGPRSKSILSLDRFPRSNDLLFYELSYSEYPSNPYKDLPEVANRWIPCTEEGKPLIKWSKGCLLKSEAESYLGCKSLAENLKGCQHIAIDIDGDHDKGYLDLDVVEFGLKLSTITKAMIKPAEHYLIKDDDGLGRSRFMYGSMHLLFKTDRVIPTIHFRNAHIDILGNEKNSMRYLKNKRSNSNQMIEMTDEIWGSIVEYIKRKEKR